MGFRSEVRVFMKEVQQFITNYENWRKKKDVTISILNTVIKELRSQNEDLMDRVLARDLPELKTFMIPEHLKEPEVYKPEEDELLAGEVTDIPEK